MHNSIVILIFYFGVANASWEGIDQTIPATKVSITILYTAWLFTYPGRLMSISS